MAQALFALGEQNNSLSQLQKAEKTMVACVKGSNQKLVQEFYEKVKARCAKELTLRHAEIADVVKMRELELD